MADPGIRAETWRAGSRLAFGDVTLLVIEHSVAHAIGVGGGLWCWSAKSPQALVIHDAGGLRAVGIDSAPVPMERLREKVPGLDALLATP